jgi:hypothetical protein
MESNKKKSSRVVRMVMDLHEQIDKDPLFDNDDKNATLWILGKACDRIHDLYTSPDGFDKVHEEIECWVEENLSDEEKEEEKRWLRRLLNA